MASSIFHFATFLLLSWMLTKPTSALGIFRPSPWALAHATFYGDETASATMGGACGYGNLFTNGYGTDTAALSSTLFNDGFACGTCFQIKCYQSSACHSTVPFTTVTATNLCPPNWAEPSDNGGWCNPPRAHFDMSKPAFMRIAEWKAGNGYWLLVYVMNVGGGGDIGSMWVKGSRTGWIRMSHNWGASYQAFASLGGQGLSFRVVSFTTGQSVVAWNAAPQSWSVGVTYSTNVNFR
ncbi:putative expansin-A30 [Senna tora]|uniref:Expansin n=1 Tax=Senna tora TaxID=362788 RepID=A0A834W5A6_9FABA|nr:putative expansin-A30 [Senna tora]